MTARPIAVTMGEPAGVGFEITLKAWAAAQQGGSTTPFVLLGDCNAAAATAAALGLPAPCPVDLIAETPDAFRHGLPVLHQPLTAPVVSGTPDPRNAPAVTGAIADGVRRVQAGEASALVTNPIQKETLAAAGFPHPGHTEYLAELTGGEAVMMLAVPGLRVVPATIHVPLARVPLLLTTDGLVRQGRILARSLAADFGITQPRIAVAGLNPHAGEGGMLGPEEQAIIAPAIAILRSDGIEAFGPLPADTLFHAEARTRFDAALCMYHDQALIPLKTIDLWGGVNVTLGLPVVRTSPDHGTALDIAGRGIARPDSLIAAIAMAQTIAARRAA